MQVTDSGALKISDHEPSQVPTIGAARRRAGPSASAAEVEALTASTAIAITMAADRDAADGTHRDAEQEHLAAQVADAGRERREAADMEFANTHAQEEATLDDQLT